MRVIEVYLVTCLVNGKQYVGQTRQGVEFRWKQHCSPSSKCTKLRNAIQKHGAGNFTVAVLCSCRTHLDANELEGHLIHDLNTVRHGYNLRYEGRCGPLESAQFCVKGHDTLRTGRYRNSTCRQCILELRAAERERWTPEKRASVSRTKLEDHHRWKRTRPDYVARVKAASVSSHARIRADPAAHAAELRQKKRRREQLLQTPGYVEKRRQGDRDKHTALKQDPVRYEAYLTKERARGLRRTAATRVRRAKLA